MTHYGVDMSKLKPGMVHSENPTGSTSRPFESYGGSSFARKLEAQVTAQQKVSPMSSEPTSEPTGEVTSKPIAGVTSEPTGGIVGKTTDGVGITETTNKVLTKEELREHRCRCPQYVSNS